MWAPSSIELLSVRLAEHEAFLERRNSCCEAGPPADVERNWHLWGEMEGGSAGTGGGTPADYPPRWRAARRWGPCSTDCSILCRYSYASTVVGAQACRWTPPQASTVHMRSSAVPSHCCHTRMCFLSSAGENACSTFAHVILTWPTIRDDGDCFAARRRTAALVGGRPPAFRQPPPMASFGPIGPPPPQQQQSERASSSGPMPMDLDVIDVEAMLADGSVTPSPAGSSEGGAHMAGPRQLPPPPPPPQRPLADRVRECAPAPIRLWPVRCTH